MKRTKWIFATLLVVAGLSSAMTVFGKSVKADLGLEQKMSICDGLGTFSVDATWNRNPDSPTYAVASGHKCRLNGVVCGTKGGCGTVLCAGPGKCEAHLTNCQIGRGGRWIRVQETVGGRFQNLITSAPSYCR